MSRQDQRSVSLVINGVNTGIWDSKDGGAVDSEETKYRKGAMGKPQPLGGSQTFENITCARLFELGRDDVLLPSLEAGAGKASVKVIELYLDVDGNVFSQAPPKNGRLKAVTPPPHDSESSDAAKIEVEISIGG